MKKLGILVCVAILLLSTAGSVGATPVLDQSSSATNLWINAQTASLTWQQEVVVGAEGLLTAIELNASSTGNIGFFINRGDAWQSDANDLYLSSVALSTVGWNTIDISSANLIFEVGDSFVIGIIGLNESTASVGLRGNADSGNGAYDPGALYLNGVLYANGGYDLGFNTYMDADYTPANPVPEPATMMLLGAGLAGLAGFKKKLKK